MKEYLEQLHSQIKQRNEKVELYKEIISNMSKAVDENNELRLQLNRCYNFIQKNLYELRFNDDLKEIQEDNMDMFKQKLFFVRGAKSISVTDENFYSNKILK